MNVGDLRRLNEGREAEVFAWGESEALRLLRPGKGRVQLEGEMLVMEGAARAGVPVPAVREIVEVDGRHGLVMDRIDGPDLLSVASARPWRIWSVAHTTARLHARLHEVVAPEELTPLREGLRRRMLGSPHVPPAALAVALAELESLPDGNRICHGDFHPGNILAGRSGPVIIDWVGATRGDPTADFARTVVLGRAAAPLDSWSRWERLLFARGRKTLMGAYERAYRRLTSADLTTFDRWLTVRLVERFADGIPEERDTLLALLANR